MLKILRKIHNNNFLEGELRLKHVFDKRYFTSIILHSAKSHWYVNNNGLLPKEYLITENKLSILLIKSTIENKRIR
jgi:hypothetical protein